MLSIASLRPICGNQIYKLAEISRPIFEINSTDLILRRLEELSNDFADQSENCFMPRTFGCGKLLGPFQKLVTEEGICYVTNMLREEDMYTEAMTASLRHPKSQYKSNWTVFWYKDNGLEAYPVRILGTGEEAGITLKLKVKRNAVTYACKGLINGYRLTMHTPGEIPRTSQQFYRIPFNTATLISVKPSGMSTSDNLRGYSPIKRQCFFEGERNLKFFKMYTQSNCEIECITKNVLNICECVQFWMPQVNGTRLCGFSDIDCTMKVQFYYIVKVSSVQWYKRFVFENFLIRIFQRKPMSLLLKPATAYRHVHRSITMLKFRILFLKREKSKRQMQQSTKSSNRQLVTVSYEKFF